MKSPTTFWSISINKLLYHETNQGTNFGERITYLAGNKRRILPILPLNLFILQHEYDLWTVHEQVS